MTCWYEYIYICIWKSDPLSCKYKYNTFAHKFIQYSVYVCVSLKLLKSKNHSSNHLLVIGSVLCPHSQKDLSPRWSDKQDIAWGWRWCCLWSQIESAIVTAPMLCVSFYLPLLFIVRGPSCDSSWCAWSMWKAKRLSLRKSATSQQIAPQGPVE